MTRPAAILLFMAAGAGASAQNLITNPDFESGTSPWQSIGCDLDLSAPLPFEGLASGFISNRLSWTSGPRTDINASLPSGTVLLITGAIRTDGVNDDDGQVKVRYDDGVNPVSVLLARRATSPGAWYDVRGIHQVIYSGPQPALDLVVQTRDYAEPFSTDDWSVTVYEEDPNWLATANAGIDANRKRDVVVSVVDVHGNPVGGTLHLQQVGRPFAFGATIEAPEFEANNTPYIDMFPTLFEWATPRNALKWRQTEATRDVLTWSRPDTVVAFCNANGIGIYGHNIFWAVEERAPDWVPGLNDSQLLAEMTERLDDLLGRYAGDIDHWDVNNEMLHGEFYLGRLGAGIRTWMFQQAQLRDPSARLYLNDYNVVGGGIVGGEAESYFDHAIDLIADGAPVGGISAQCHFDTGPIIAKWLRDRLDVLASTGLPVRLTEFDVVRPDVNERADDIEKFFRVAFSHPSVDGITFWGWWAGNHGKGPDAAIVDTDFTINAAGQRYLDLLDEWTTDLIVATGRDGQISTRAFHGTYEASISAAGFSPVPVVFELEPGPDPESFVVVAIGDCVADIDADNSVNFFDTLGFLGRFDAGDERMDLDASGDLTSGDVLEYLNQSQAGCP